MKPASALHCNKGSTIQPTCVHVHIHIIPLVLHARCARTQVRTASCAGTACVNSFGDEQLAVDMVADKLLFEALKYSVRRHASSSCCCTTISNAIARHPDRGLCEACIRKPCMPFGMPLPTQCACARQLQLQRTCTLNGEGHPRRWPPSSSCGSPYKHMPVASTPLLLWRGHSSRRALCCPTADPLLRDAPPSTCLPARPQHVCKYACSEEVPEPVDMGGEGFSVAFDPLDGSSIVDTNFAVGTIFGVWPGDKLKDITGREQVGKQPAAGSSCTGKARGRVPSRPCGRALMRACRCMQHVVVGHAGFFWKPPSCSGGGGGSSRALCSSSRNDAAFATRRDQRSNHTALRATAVPHPTPQPSLKGQASTHYGQ